MQEQDNIKFIKELKEYAKKYTYTGLSKKLGYSESTLCTIANGYYPASIKYVKAKFEEFIKGEKEHGK